MLVLRGRPSGLLHKNPLVLLSKYFKNRFQTALPFTIHISQFTAPESTLLFTAIPDIVYLVYLWLIKAVYHFTLSFGLRLLLVAVQTTGYYSTYLGARRALTPLALSPLVRMLVRMLERRESLRRAHVRCLVRVQLEREP